MNNKAQSAWELYLKMETSPESFNLLLLIANDCYRMGEFWYAAKAFDMLDRLEPNPEFWEGKRGAIVGVFQVCLSPFLFLVLIQFYVLVRKLYECVNCKRRRLYLILIIRYFWKMRVG